MDNTTTTSRDIQSVYRNSSVTKLGGNQYKVTIGEESKTVDLDGLTIMSDEDYESVEKAGLLQDDMFSPSMWNITGEEDLFFMCALRYAANYSGFNAEEYTEENK